MHSMNSELHQTQLALKNDADVFAPSELLLTPDHITIPLFTMATQRRKPKNSDNYSDILPERAHRSDVEPGASKLKWFKIYYAILSTSVLTLVAVWFTFYRNPHPVHPSYDTLTFLPYATKNQIMFWYRDHAPKVPATDSTMKSAPRNDVPHMLTFLQQYANRGYIDSPAIRNPEHYLEAFTNGWIAGIFESVSVDEQALKEIKQEESGVGSIPGGSRRLNEKLAKVTSPIVTLLREEPSAEEHTPLNSTWTNLSQEHRSVVYEGLSHCHTTPCRLAKMQLISQWREQLALFPEHENKERWNVLIQLFHPDTHLYKLIDAPPTADALGALWLRFFSTGDAKYIDRIIDLTRLTGAKAYADEKDKEILEWTAKKHARALMKQLEEWEQQKISARKAGEPEPPQPDPLPMPQLPPSPTGELHQHFVNSLLYYAEDHTAVKQTVQRSFSKWPKDTIMQTLMKSPSFAHQP